jgi:hypothetical protein
MADASRALHERLAAADWHAGELTSPATDVTGD